MARDQRANRSTENVLRDALEERKAKFAAWGKELTFGKIFPEFLEITARLDARKVRQKYLSVKNIADIFKENGKRMVACTLSHSTENFDTIKVLGINPDVLDAVALILSSSIALINKLPNLRSVLGVRDDMQTWCHHHRRLPSRRTMVLGQVPLPIDV
jgi:hypothetical protein